MYVDDLFGYVGHFFYVKDLSTFQIHHQNQFILTTVPHICHQQRCYPNNLPSVIREAQSTESGKNLDSWILMSKLRMKVIPSEINANSWNTKLWSLFDVYLNWVTLLMFRFFNSRINNRHFLDLTLKQMANLRVDGKRLLLDQLFCLDDILSIDWLYNVSSNMTLSWIYRSIFTNSYQ